MECSFLPSGDELVRKTITVGSRKSKLALIQTHMVIDELKRYNSDIEFVVKTMDTIGDNILDKPLSKIGEKALFTRELEEELLCGSIDLIVHSLKDLPTKLPDKCCISAITKRQDPSDSLVYRESLSHLACRHSEIESILADPSIKTFGTSSLRRISQLKSLRSDAVVRDVRGNLNTRLDKLDNHETNGYDCLILATAGLIRAGFENRISHKLNWYHAVSQGALGIECRLNDKYLINKVIRPLVDRKTTLECTAERVFMNILQGGCSVPIGVRTLWDNSMTLTLEGIVLSLDGTQQIKATATENLDNKLTEKAIAINVENCTDIVIVSEGDELYETQVKNSVILGQKLAHKMIEMGVRNILDEISKEKKE